MTSKYDKIRIFDYENLIRVVKKYGPNCPSCKKPFLVGQTFFSHRFHQGRKIIVFHLKCWEKKFI